MKQSGIQSKYSPTESAEIGYVQFVALSQEHLESFAVTEISEEHLYEGSKPCRNSPNDLRLGISNPSYECQTCGQTKQCQGHFGYIKLTEAIYHYGFLKFLEKILKCVCHTCARVKRPMTDQQWKKFSTICHIESPNKKLNEMAKLLHNIKQCPPKQDDKGKQLAKSLRGCQSRIPTKVSIKNYKIWVQDLSEFAQRKLKIIERGQVRRILQELSRNRDDCRILGFTVTKPIDLMIRSLVVPPPQIRPSIEMNSERKAEDDLTSTYVRILSMNKDIEQGNFQFADKKSRVDDLQRLVASIMIKLDRTKIQRSSLNQRKAIKNIKSISDRLKGKEGRFRQNLMGKRVDFSARSVISPDPNLALDQLGVPQKVAHKLTIPEEITKWNYDRILKLCQQGKVQVLLRQPEERLRDSERPIRVQKIEPSQLEKYINYGMIAERSLQDGDYVLFNRQPTLHRMSMMAHRVKILPYNTFRLNLSVCTPYNADFDGDEMNMHVPQSFETISELKNIAHVPKQIVTPKNNAPVMGIVQDALLGIFLFTMRDTFLTREEIMNLVVWIEGKDAGVGTLQNFVFGQLPIPAILKPYPLWTGKQVMSLIIPKKISIQITKGSNKYESQENIKDVSMIIKKGELLTGALQKEIVGSGAGGLIHSIWLQIGPDATNQFITITQKIVNNWLISNGFSVGAADIVPHESLQAIINHEKQKIHNLYFNILNQYRNIQEIQQKNLHQKGKKILDSYEYNINANLNNKLGKAQNIVKENVSPYSNNIFKMITAKSKGSETNLAQIMFLVGNQNVDGKRCPLGFTKRALPHFCKDDNSAQPRGFVYNSFYEGLKPHEFFFHAMGGREGLSDTAVKTSRTGYIQRKLMKSLEDLVIKYDGTVRDSKNNLLQKMYGEDGFMSEYIEKHKYTGAQLTQKEFKERYLWNDTYLLEHYEYKSEEIVKIKQQYEKLKEGRKRMKELFVEGKDTTTIQYYCPIRVDRLINKIKATNYGFEKDVIDPLTVHEKVQKLLEKCIPPQSIRNYIKIIDEIRMKGFPLKKANERIKQFQKQNGIQIFRIHLRYNLASKILCEKVKISKVGFIGLIEEIETKFFQALVPSGESVGSISAQSIGQPTTQMTLNTFHLAGVSDRNVTLGVPRLQELLDASKNIKTPSMTIHLQNKILYKDKGIPKNQKLILQVSEYHLPERNIKHYVEACRFFYDPDPLNSNAGFTVRDYNEKRRTPWVVNLQFSCKKMIKRLWDEILLKIEEKFSDQFEMTELIQFNEAQDSTNPQIVLRLYENALDFSVINGQKNEEKQYLCAPLNFLAKKQLQIKNTRVGGIEKIKSVKTSKRVIIQLLQNESINLSDTEKQQFQYTVFETDGSNLKKCLQNPFIDSKKTTCNDINQILSVLGIQAARQAFINEFKEVLKPYGIYINSRHLSILTQWMSVRGFITPINRNGINRVKDISILRKASYEQTADMLFGAAVFSERDYLKGVSEKIIFGQPAELGTSHFKVMIDCEKVGNYVSKAEIDKKQIGLEKSVDYAPYNSYIGQNTPILMNTPMYEGGKSILSQRSPGAFQMNSPAFTPMRNIDFTPTYENHVGFSAQRSPVQQTPLPFQTPLQNTPNYANNLGAYGSPVGGSSYYNRNPNSSVRSPYYYQNSTSSPNYSSIRQLSQSPDYNNSPLKSAYSSPNYGSMASDSERKGNYKEEEDREDEEDF